MIEFKNNRELGVFYAVAFAPIAILVAIMIFLYKSEDSAEYFISTIIHQQYHSVVTKKVIDYKNHATQYVILSSGDGDSIIASNDWIDLWNYAEVGDSIVKAVGDSCLFLHKENDSILSLRYNFASSGTIFSRDEHVWPLENKTY